MLTARQGDVGFIARRIPRGAKKISLRPFALGEKTGHAHCISIADEAKAQMFEMDGRTFLRVSKDGEISIHHEDHDPQGKISLLPAGWEGEVVIAREYDEEQDFHRVTD